ncbi:MAG TPA: protocatechuate 3,4-dioxygenase subunit beta [Thermohalobaculum sp.]|nr:protocatechuate 3,4-dioxygenase subunit beta [Thermohalobaculum sp.]
MPGDFYPRDRAWHPPALAPAYKTSLARAPRRPLVALGQTLSETTGPVFGPSGIGPLDHDLLRNHAGDGPPIGERILVHGRVLDENARPVAGALIEVWQANAGGRYRHVNDGYLAPLDPNFGGWGRTLTDAEGAYVFRTVRPGPYPWPNGVNSWRPAHIHFSLLGHAFCQRLITQMYFEGDPLVPRCAIVNTLPDPAAVERLVAPLDLNAAEPFDALAYRFDIVLRGRRATPFENRPEGS